MKLWKILASLALVLVFVGCGAEDGSASRPMYKDGDRIVLKSVMGNEIVLLRKHGGFVLEGDESKILILDIFGTFCLPCQKEAPNLMDFQLKNDKDVLLIAFTYLESVSDQYVIDNFATKFNAYYFIVNSPNNDMMVNTIASDIGYKRAVQIPFKVVLKDGKYQYVTDVHEGSLDKKFYIGEISTDVIIKDIKKIMAQ